MPIYEFAMSCGHFAKRECADPSKYLQVDKKYYKAQGLCDECWKRLHESHQKERCE